jgi:hypothetical protein
MDKSTEALQVPDKKKNWFKRHKVVTILSALVVLLFIVSANSKPSTPQANTQVGGVVAHIAAPSDPNSTPVSQPTPTQKKTILSLDGNGDKQTQKFTVSGDWDLEWSYDCSSRGIDSGAYYATIYNDDGTRSYENPEVSQSLVKSSDTQHYYKDGTFYLNISSTCSWHVNVKN